MTIIDPVPALEQLAAAARALNLPRVVAAAETLAGEFRAPAQPPEEHARAIVRGMKALDDLTGDISGRVKMGSRQRRIRQLTTAYSAFTREIGLWIAANPELSQVEL